MIYNHAGDLLSEQGKAIVKYLPYQMTRTTDTKISLCMCAIKTEIVKNKIPFASGFLFHKLGTISQELYYGKTLNEAESIGSVNFYPKDCVMAVSPTDGRIIAANRSLRGSLYVYDGTTKTKLFTNAELKPMGWLYNSGIDFIIDVHPTSTWLWATRQVLGASRSTTGRIMRVT